MNELNLPEETMDDKMDDEIFEIFNNKVMNQEEAVDYREVHEQESHLIVIPNQKKEIVIIRKPSKYLLFPEGEEEKFGDDES
jgi:hypothetical protein